MAAQLATFKVPRWWEFRDAVPHTPSERIAKHRLGPPTHPLVDLLGGRTASTTGGSDVASVGPAVVRDVNRD